MRHTRPLAVLAVSTGLAAAAAAVDAVEEDWPARFGLLPPGMAGREPWTGPNGEAISFDPEKSKELLAEAARGVYACTRDPGGA